MMSTQIQTIVKGTAALVVGFGIVIALAAHPTTAGVAAFFMDLLFWPLDGSPHLDGPAVRLLAGIGGGVMVGWGVTLWLVGDRLLRSDPALATSMIRASIFAWFGVDSAASIVAGAPLNALLNIGFVAAFLWPMSRQARTGS
jgi:hypothetical protein